MTQILPMLQLQPLLDQTQQQQQQQQTSNGQQWIIINNPNDLALLNGGVQLMTTSNTVVNTTNSEPSINGETATSTTTTAPTRRKEPAPKRAKLSEQKSVIFKEIISNGVMSEQNTDADAVTGEPSDEADEDDMSSTALKGKKKRTPCDCPNCIKYIAFFNHYYFQLQIISKI